MTRITTASALVLLWAVVVSPPALADAPLRPPFRHTECSPSKRACVTSDPTQGTFAHAPGHPDKASALWTIPRWFRVLHPTDDADVVVTGYDGLSLAPLESPMSIEVVSFWRRGVLTRSYKLSEVLSDQRALRRTDSHYEWGSYRGIDSAGRLRISIIDGTVLVFDPATAAVLRRERPVK